MSASDQASTDSRGKTDDVNMERQLGNMERQLQQRDDEELFKQPPKADDCPICLQMLPNLFSNATRFMACCSKTVCSGCAYACERKGYDVVCPHCKAELPENLADSIQQLTKRAEANNAQAMCVLGLMYQDGVDGVEKDRRKAMTLLLRASELGSTLAHLKLAITAKDDEYEHYLELAAKNGCPLSRYFLGNEEANRGKIDRAIMHWKLACEGGHPGALKSILRCVQRGTASRDDYRKSLQSYQQYLKDVKTTERDEAAAHSDHSKYLLDADDFNHLMVV